MISKFGTIRRKTFRGFFGRLLPARSVIALLRRGLENRFDAFAPRQNQHLKRKRVEQLHARADFLWIGNLIPATIRADNVQDQAFDFKAVFLAEDAVKQFRAELVKAVAAPIIGAGVRNDTPVLPNHFHAVLQSHGKIENMFECAAIINQIKPLL